MQRVQAGQRRNAWQSGAGTWHKGLFLGVLFVLMSLCHGVVAPVDAAAATDGTAVVAVATDEQPPARECAASKRLAALSDRRGSAATLDLPAEPLAFTAHEPSAARGLRVAPLAIPANHRALLQVFRM